MADVLGYLSGFSQLVGKVVTNLKTDIDEDTFEIVFVELTCSDGSRYRLQHSQECCENVSLIEGKEDLPSLIGQPILLAEMRGCNKEPLDDEEVEDGVYEWTYYALATINGNVDLRFYGTSNGYYGTSVDFVKLVDVERADYKTGEKYMSKEWR